MGIIKDKLSKQAQHWESTFLRRPEMFGSSSSFAAKKALEIFKKKGLTNIIEIGAGQGRDTLFFAKNGLHVHALDYSQSGIDIIKNKTNKQDLVELINTKCFDVRKPLPFNRETFDACFSHMLYCMAFTSKELENLSSEINRVLKPGGLNIFTVRHTGDADYKKGFHRGEDLYESGGFIVHFFSKEKVKHLSKGFDIINIENFEEGKFPRKLFYITLKKQLPQQ